MTLNIKHRSFRGEAQLAQIRTAQFNDKEHIVVPVVALVGNTIVEGMNASGPEFVPAETLSIAPGGWDGRPTVPDHPNNGKSSANEPHILETQAFGQLFNTEFSDNRLRTEAWLDPERAESVGDDAMDVLRRIQSGELVEVSVGAWVGIEKQSGEHEGEHFDFIWRDITPDHLAMLPAESTGACSAEDGCGAPRVNRSKEKDMARSALERVMSVLNKWRASQEEISASQEGMSDSELRSKLWNALQSVVPGFDAVEEVFQSDGLVIYTTWTADDGFMWWRRGFTVSDSEEVTLKDDREQVEPAIEFRPVANTDTESTDSKPDDSTKQVTKQSLASDCTCNTPGKGEDNEGDSPMSEPNPLVDKVIANKASPFTEADVEYLSTLSDERLGEFDKGFVEVDEEDETEELASADESTKSTESSDESTAESNDDPTSVDDWLASNKAPDAVKDIVTRSLKEEEVRRTTLINGLVKAQKHMDAETLQAKPTAELETLTQMLELDSPKQHDYSGSRTFSQLDKSKQVPRPYSLASKETN